MTKYRIKLENGRVLGPFSMEEFVELCSKGHVTGNEQYQIFPTGSWKALSSNKDLSNHIKQQENENTSSEATFIRKLNLADLKKEKYSKPEIEITLENNSSGSETLAEFENELEIKKIEPSAPIEVEHTKEQKEFPKAFNFKSDKEAPKEVVKDEITETEINEPHENNFDKTQINSDTVKYLEELEKQKALEEKLAKEKLAAEEAARAEEVDLENDSTQFIDAKLLKTELRQEVQEAEEEINFEIKEKEKAEKQKAKNLAKQKKKAILEEEQEEEQEAKSKKKKMFLAVVGVLFLVILLFPDEPDKKAKQITTIEPLITFPQRFDTPDEKKAQELHKKGLADYSKHTYMGYLEAVESLRASVENQFNDNQAMYKLIYLYSELIEDVSDPLVRVDNANTTFKLLQIFMTKVFADPWMATAAANFYYSIGKIDASVMVVEKYMSIKTNKPSMDLFGVYMRALLKSGDLDKSKVVFEKLKSVAKRPFTVDLRVMEYLQEIQQQDEALKILNALSEKYQNNVRLLLVKAEIYLHSGDYNSLEILLNKIQELSAGKSPVFYAKYLEYRGMVAVSKKDVTRALKYFKKSLKINENFELRSRLASLDETMDENANALIKESKAIKFLGLAKSHLRKKNDKFAFKAALDAVSIAPNYIPAKLYLAKLQTSKSFYKEAITTLEKLYKDNVNNYDVIYALMDTYADAYKFKELDQMIRNVAQTEFRNDPRFLKIQAKKFLQKDNFTFAIQWLQQAINRNPLDDELIFQMAELYIKYKKFNEGKVLLKKAMELDPSKVEYDIKYAEIIYEIDGVEAAIGYLYNILMKHPDNIKALSTVGIYYYNSGQMKHFEETKKKIEKVSNKDKSLYEFLVLAAKRDERPQDVIKYSIDLLNIDPGDLGARMFLGKVYMEQEKFKEALLEFREVEERLDTYPNLQYNLSKLYLLVDNVEKAIEYADKEIKANPSSVNGYILLGDIYRKQKDFALSEKNYKQAQKINSNNVDALVGLATLNFMKSQFAISLDLFTKAQKISPERADTYKLLGDVYRKIGQSTLAVEQYKTFLELSPNTMYRENLSNYIKMME